MVLSFTGIGETFPYRHVTPYSELQTLRPIEQAQKKAVGLFV